MRQKIEEVAVFKESFDILSRGHPIKRTHRKIIIFSAVNSKLFFEVVKRIKRIKGMSSIRPNGDLNPLEYVSRAFPKMCEDCGLKKN